MQRCIEYSWLRKLRLTRKCGLFGPVEDLLCFWAEGLLCFWTDGPFDIFGPARVLRTWEQGWGRVETLAGMRSPKGGDRRSLAPHRASYAVLARITKDLWVGLAQASSGSHPP